MVCKIISTALVLCTLAVAATAQGTQFITGACKSDNDCASQCCGFTTGKCAGPIIAQQRDGGCGFGDGTPNDRAAKALGFQGGPQPAAAQAATPAPAAAPAAGETKAPGTQFITGACKSDADCGSGCCGFKTGKCAGAVVAQERDGGCGFGDQTPNDNAVKALRGGAQTAPATQAATAAEPAAAPAAGEAKAPGTQFITGECKSDADCASGCCGFNTGRCAGAVIAQARDGGCGFGDQSPNDTAAKKLLGAQAGGDAAAAGGAGKQFITGACKSDADCGSGCCGFKTGKCAGAVVAQERDGGCGFGDQTPNDNAVKALRGN